MTYGIEQTSQAFEALVAIKDAYEQAKSDGSVGLNDLAFLLGVLPKVTAAIDGSDEIPAELADLDPAEIAELKEKFGELIADENLKQAFQGFALLADGIFGYVQSKNVAA